MRKSRKLTIEQINQRMDRIFASNGVKKPQGDEEFWNQLDEVQKKNPYDAGKLKRLEKLWTLRIKEEQNQPV